MRARHFVSGLLFILILGTPVTAGVQVVATASGDVNGFDLFHSGLYWWSGLGLCTQEFHSDTQIGIVGVIGLPPRMVLSDCTAHVPFVTRDDTYVYFWSNKHVWRKAVNSASGDPAADMFSPITTDYVPGAMMVWNGRVYWTDSLPGSFLSTFNVYSSNPDGSSPGSLPLTAGENVSKIVHFTWQRGFLDFVDSIFLLAGDLLLRFDVDPPGDTWTILAAGVSDFALRNESVTLPHSFSSFTTVYAALGQSPAPASVRTGSLVRLDAGGGDLTTLYTAAGSDQVMSVAVDGNYLFLTEQALNCFADNCSAADPTSIRRQFRPAGNPDNGQPWDLILSTVFTGDGGTNLRSDGDWLYFMQLKNIKRIETGAPPIGFDIQADGLEAVQNSQDLNSAMSLVAHKPTFARGYAHIVTNTTPKTTFFPNAILHGYLDGTEFSDSPITSVNNTQVDATASLDKLRGSLKTSFLFQLPDDWIQPGSLTLTMTVNPDDSIPETGSNPLANNSVSLAAPARVVQKGKPCLVFVPMHTSAPNYELDDPDSGIAGILARARSLLPVEDFRVYFQTDHVDKPVPEVCVCIPPVQINLDPFNLDDDQDWGIFWLAVRDFLSDDPPNCPDLHWVGTAHSTVGGFNGIGEAPGSHVIVRMEPVEGPKVWDAPRGGRSLAHELGHNYGRQHIDQTTSGLGCGSSQPKGPWDSYPFDACTIGPANGPGAIYGYDPISGSVMGPNVGGDLMSYSTTRWISPFTWNAISGGTGGGGEIKDLTDAPSPGGGGAPAGPFLIVHGSLLRTGGTGEFDAFYLLPADSVDLAKVTASLAAASALPAKSPVQVRTLNGTGGTIASVPAVLLETSDDTPDRLGLVQFLQFNAQTRKVQLLDGTKVLAERVVSAHAPAVDILSLDQDAAAETIHLTWHATDLDGDPLYFTVQYSSDGGATWRALRVDYPWQSIILGTRMLPGSTKGRLRVLASDGVNTAMATSQQFTIGKHAPKVLIDGVTPEGRIAYGSAVQLEGLAIDAEDGSIDAGKLSWKLTGPTPRTGTGSRLPLGGLSPGKYSAALSASDSDGQTGTRSIDFEVLPLVVPETAAPVFDGTGSDPAYADAALVQIPQGGGRSASARLLHSGGELFVSLTGLRFGADPSRRTAAGLTVDPNDSRDANAQPDDIGFLVADDGVAYETVGQGGAMAPTLSPRSGFSALIARGSGGWSAELRIADALLGGWNHAAGILLTQTGAASPTDVRAWPASANANSPASWAPAWFGTPPPPANRAPVAAVGPDQALVLEKPLKLFLDGGPSHDPDGDPLTYRWKQLAGPAVTLTDADKATASFTANPVASDTTLTFQLQVADASLSSTATSKVTILAMKVIAAGGKQRPGDANQDGKLDLSDAIWLLGYLFLGSQPELPCEGGTAAKPGPGDLALIDINGDGKIDLSDAVSLLGYLFLGSKPPALGTDCVPISGCRDKCVD